jgi:hypothetical protein
MKKFLIIALTAVFCLALAGPAMAKVSVSGMLTSDYYYLDQNEQRAGGNGNTFTQFDLPRVFNRLTIKYASDDNAIRGLMELRGGEVGGGTTTDPAYVNYAWIDWQLSPAAYLRFGRQTQAFSIMAPQQMVGFQSGHVVGIGYGNIHGGSSRDGVRLYYKFSDMARIEVQLLDPDNDGNEVIGGVTFQGITFPAFSTQAGGVRREENVIPRFDVSLPLTFGNVVIEPSFTYLKQEYDEVAAGWDDSVDIWGLALGGRGAFGMFSFAAEINYGQNLGDGNYVGGAPANALAYTPDGGSTWLVEDAKILAFWLQIGLKLGPSTVYGIYGQSKTEWDNLASPGVTGEVTRKMYGISWPISVVKGFTIRPELMFYDLDDGARFGTSRVDFGDETLFGIQAMLVF